jgi:alkylated DNA nucleotide flippase Atl1
MKTKGWWRIAVSNDTLSKLDSIKKELEEELRKEGVDVKLSYDKVIRKLIEHFKRSKPV